MLSLSLVVVKDKTYRSPAFLGTYEVGNALAPELLIGCGGMAFPYVSYSKKDDGKLLK